MGLLPAGKGGAGPGVQGLDLLLRLAHLLLGDPQILGDGVVLLPGQPLQVLLDDGQGGARLSPAAQLNGQALGQVLGAHPRRVQGLEQGQAVLQHRSGQARRLGQVGHAVPEIAVLVQTGGQELGAPEHQRGGVAPLQLAGQMEEQGVLQPPVGAHPGQGVQLVPVGGDVLPVLVVQVGQRLEPPPQLLPLVARVRRFGELGGGVLLDQLLDVLVELQGAHLQDLHGLEHLGTELQRLFQGQLQIHGISSCSVKMVYSSGSALPCFAQKRQEQYNTNPPPGQWGGRRGFAGRKV